MAASDMTHTYPLIPPDDPQCPQIRAREVPAPAKIRGYRRPSLEAGDLDRVPGVLQFPEVGSLWPQCNVNSKCADAGTFCLLWLSICLIMWEERDMYVAHRRLLDTPFLSG